MCRDRDGNERILLRTHTHYTHKHTLQMRGKVPFIVSYIGFQWAWAWIGLLHKVWTSHYS